MRHIWANLSLAHSGIFWRRTRAFFDKCACSCLGMRGQKQAARRNRRNGGYALFRRMAPCGPHSRSLYVLYDAYAGGARGAHGPGLVERQGGAWGVWLSKTQEAGHKHKR